MLSDSPTTPVSGRKPKIWRISPGENAKFWDECLKGGFIAISWAEFGDLSELTREQFDAKMNDLCQQHNWTRGAQQAWAFAKDIKVGDTVIANQGLLYLLAVGRVTSPYYFEPGSDFPHRLSVEWEDQTPRRVATDGWVSTLGPVSGEKFPALLAAPRVTTAETIAMRGIRPSQTPWALALLRSMQQIGRSATPAELKQHIREHWGSELAPELWDKVVQNARFGSIQRGLKAGELLAIEDGRWTLTSKGRDLARALAEVAIDLAFNPWDPQVDESRLEYVPVTSLDAYTRPILEELRSADRVSTKQLGESIRERYGSQFLDGDRRVAASGRVIWKQRLQDAVDKMKASGLIENSGRGHWRLTGRGVDEVATVSDKGWSFEEFQSPNFRAQVLREDEPGAMSDEDTEPGTEDEALPRTWALREPLPPELRAAVRHFLRLDLGPSPNLQIPLARNLIFYGPPGTGKTFLARSLAQQLGGDFRLVQFHPSYSYEDFVQGIRPNLTTNHLSYELRKGPFAEICESACQAEDRYHVLVIDEINRGDAARVFGELLYALEYRNDPVTLAGGGEIKVPQNLIVIGTMNSVDRSVALVDYALRRRFRFLRVDPLPELALQRTDTDATAAVRALRALNSYLERERGVDYTIGHSYLLNASYATLDADDCQRLWTYELKPLLEEYFFGQAQQVASAHAVWNKALDTNDA